MSERYKEFKSVLKNIEQNGLDDAILECFPINFYRQQWDELAEDPKLTEQKIIKYSNYLDWKRLSRLYNFSLQFLQKCEDKIEWINYSQNKSKTEEIIRCYADKLEWYNVMATFDFSTELLREFEKYISISWIVRHKEDIDLSIINQFKEKLDEEDWDYISRFDNLTDNFIEKNIEKLNLEYIPKRCKNKELKLKVNALHKGN